MFWRKKQKKEQQFKCKECGLIHSGWPALAYSSPDNYNQLSQEEKDSIAEIDEDFCTIKHDDQIDRFIRVALIQEVIEKKND